MPTLKELRVEAQLSVSQLARVANLDIGTVRRAESGEAIRDIKAVAILNALNHQLGTSYRINQIDGLHIL